MVTRREQLGTSDAHLADEGVAPKKERKGKGRGRGRGKGKGRGEPKKGDKKKHKKTPEKTKPEKVMKRPAGSRASKVVESPTPKAQARKKAKGEKDAPKQEKKEPKQKKIQKVQEQVDQGNNGAKKRKDCKDKSEQKKDGEVTAPSPDVPKPPRKVARTWAGRWIPTDPFLLRKMNAIRQVFDSCVAKKIRSQSSFQNPFFVLCSRAFKTRGIDKSETTFEQFVAEAELQVEGFLKQDSVSH